MKAMILAAGRGERMRPLTDTTPKPLLLIAGKPIIQHTIEQLVSAGFTDIVINTAHLGKQIQQTLGSGKKFGASIIYSDEGETALETAGGIANALPLLGKDTFLVVNGDIANDFNFNQLHNKKIDLAHLILIPNPPHHSEGDFHLTPEGRVLALGQSKLTYSGIALFNPELFNKTKIEKSKLGPLLRQVIPQQRVSGEKYNGFWVDIGTPERLKEVEVHLSELKKK